MSALISYRNLADTVTLAGSVIAGYPLANLQKRQLSSKCRMTYGNAITLTFTAPVQPDVVALLGTNCTMSNSAIRTEYSDDGSSWMALPLVYLNDGGVLSLPRHLYADISTVAAHRYWRITPYLEAMNGATYVEMSRLWLGPAIVLDKGVDSNWSLSFDDAGSLDASRGRQYYEEPGTRTRVLRVSISKMPSDIAFGYAANAASAADVPSIQGLQMEAGVTGEVIALPRTSSVLAMRRMGVFGHVDPNDRPAINHIDGDVYSTQFSVVGER